MAPRLLIENPRFREMRRAAARYTELTGDQAYLYAYAPGEPDAGLRFVFQHRVCHGITAALNYARALGSLAEQQAREAADAAEHQRIIETLKDIT